MPPSKAQLDRIDAMVDRLHAGATNAEVARDFGVTVGRVSQIRTRHGIPLPPGHFARNPGDINDRSRAIMDALRAGRRQADIARQFGVSRQFVHRLARRIRDIDEAPGP